MMLLGEILVEIAMIGSVIAAVALLAFFLRLAARELLNVGAGTSEPDSRRPRRAGLRRTGRAGSGRARDAAR